MASTQAEAEASRNGPEAKDIDGPNTNGVETQRDMDSTSTNGPAAPPLSNNGPHDVADKMQSANPYYKQPPTSAVGYPPPAGYESNQYGYPHSYMHQQSGELQHQQPGSYPYSQYPGGNVRNMAPVASKPTSYMPRNPAAPVSGYPPAGQGYPPSRYPTPTLNQLLQPGSGPQVQRYPYGDYPQQTQQPPANSHVPNWNMQQPPRGYAPSPGFKPPPNAMTQQPQQYPAYGPGMQPGAPQRYPSIPPGGGAPAAAPIHPQQQDTVKSSSGVGEPPGEANANASQRNSSSPSGTTPAPSSTPSAVSRSPTPTTTVTSNSTTVNSPAVGGRPAPSPSPANRPMSPALGPANSNSSGSNHNASPSPAGDNNSGGQARMSHSPMAAQGAYQQPMPPPPHVGMPPYKMSPGPYQQPPQSMPQPPQQQPAPGQPQQPQYLPNPMYMQHPRPPMGAAGPNMYGPGGAAYGPPPTSTPTGPPPPNSANSNASNPMPPASPGPNRPMGPHMGPPTPYPGYPSGPSMGQYGQQQPAWGPNSMPGAPPGSPMPSHGGKGLPPPPTGPPTPGPRPAGPPHTPPHYTKQHLQHHLQQQQQQKMYGMAPSPGSGPPAPSQGPPQQPPNQSQQQQQQIMGPYPPPGMPNAASIAGHPPSAASPVTNIVTTGPDGVAGLDEASQQSTLSNTSAASGDDASTPSTPRPRKEAPAPPHHPPFSHPATPQSTAPSPGAGQPPAQHDEFREGTSPAPNAGNWKPTPASPVRTPETKKSHVSDALAKLYEFDDHPDRRKFIDQLLRFMEEKGTPITACPAISKNPLDLFRLYLLVRERGGFLEVTKNKTWKDIAQTLGIGASSSAAYTLRKHYTKSLFPWECKYDRGGVDPQPILNQVEASTKKKPPSKALSVPSPAGSSNSQDSFPASGVPPIPSMDGYPNSHYPGYPPPHAGENIAASNPFDDQQHHYGGRPAHPAHPGYPPPPPPPGPQQGQQAAPQPPQPAGPAQQQQQQQQPPPQAQPPSMYGPMPNRPGYPGMSHPSHPSHPSQGYHHPYQGEYPNNQQYPPYPPNRTMYPPYGEPYNSQAPPSGQAPPPGGPPAGPDPYGRYMPPNASAPPPAPNASYMARPPAPTSAPSAAPPHAQPMPPQPAPAQPPSGNTSAGPSPAPSPAPNVVAPTYTEQNDQYQQRSGLRQLLASSPLAQQLATPSPDNRQSGYSATPTSLGPPPGQPYPGLIRPGTPGPNSAPPRPAAPTPMTPMTPMTPTQPPNAMVQPAPGAPPAPGAQQPGQAPYPPYGPPGQPGSQPRQPYAWRGPAPYGNQYPPTGPGASPGPVQTAGAPWVPPTGNQQPRNPAWDQTQRYPGPMPASPAAPYNGTSQSGPGAPATPGMQQQMPPQQPPGAPPNQQQWSGPQMANARPPFPRPPYRPADGKPYPMPPMPGKPMMQGPYPQAPMQMYQPKSQFPPDSVEAVAPVMSKRRRLCRADVAPVDAWRVYLSLKSGLLAESTWAIDVLNVLLFDDASVHYFTLGYMPGLLEVLLEHFRRVLSEIFAILEDMEIGYDRIDELKNAKSKRRALCAASDGKTGAGAAADDEAGAWWVRRRPEPEELDDSDLGAVRASDVAGERVRMLDGPDLSLAARRREKIGVVPRERELFVSDKRKEWDVHEGFESGTDQWQMGGGDTTQHIVTHFTAELNIVPFVRVMRKTEKRPETPPAVQEREGAGREPEPKASTPKNCLAKKTRSLADVLQRIKKEAAESEPADEAPKQPDVRVEIKEEPVEEEAPKAEAPKEEAPKEDGETPKEDAPKEDAPKEEVAKEAVTVEEKQDDKPRLQIRDPHSTLKRRGMDDYEDECYSRDETSLHLVDDSQDALSRRALALSNILRSLSFLPTNEMELARNPSLLVVVGKLLLLHHDHPLRSASQKNYDREEDVDFACDPTPSATRPDDWWWMDALLVLRENALVLLANIAGQLDLSNFSEEIVRPLIDGLLHWAICPSAQAQDPFGSFGPGSSSLLSPQRLSLEALCKLLVLEANVDLILATPPFSRLEKLVHSLTKSLCRTEDQVLREFAVNVLYYLSAADSGMARLISMHNNSLGLLVSFVEQAETNAMVVASQHGIQALRENPESMGTSLDMLRRAASTIFHIARHPESRPLIAKLEQRLLSLVMSQIMDQSVAAILSRSLYLCNTDDD